MISDNFKKLFDEGLKISKSLSSSIGKASNAIASKKQIISFQQEAKRRLDICNKCEFLNKEFGRCEHCGCFVTAKVKLDFESCPISKW